MLTSDWRLAIFGLAVIVAFALVPMLWDPVAERIAKRADMATDGRRPASARPKAQVASFLEQFQDESSRSSLLMATAQTISVILGIAGAIGHAFFKADYSRTLNLDIVTIAWVGLAIVGFMLPEILDFGSGRVKAKVSRIRRGAEDIEQAPIETTGLADAEALPVFERNKEASL